MPGLPELQRAFAAAIFADALDTMVPLVRDRGLSPARRLQVYRNNVFAGLTEALRALYRVTECLVGEDFFRQTARAYVRSVPSASGDLHDYGATFPEFLAGLPAAAGLPYLPDVARLEWCFHRVFHAAGGAPLDPARLAGVPAEQRLGMRLRLQPAARLLASPYPVLAIWGLHQEGADPQATLDLDAGGVRVLVIRRGLEVRLEALGAGEHAWLAALVAGAGLVAATALALAAEPGFDLAATLAAHLRLGTFLDGSLAAEAQDFDPQPPPLEDFA
jgi:hypothetical protein